MSNEEKSTNEQISSVTKNTDIQFVESFFDGMAARSEIWDQEKIRPSEASFRAILMLCNFLDKKELSDDQIARRIKILSNTVSSVMMLINNTPKPEIDGDSDSETLQE